MIITYVNLYARAGNSVYGEHDSDNDKAEHNLPDAGEVALESD